MTKDREGLLKNIMGNILLFPYIKTKNVFKQSRPWKSLESKWTGWQMVFICIV